mgnify:CR=1 FL=1
MTGYEVIKQPELDLREDDYLVIKRDGQKVSMIPVQKIIDLLGGKIIGFDSKIVEELPEEGEKGILYLLQLSEGTETNLYEEYIWIGERYELLGSFSTDIDISKKNDTITITEESEALTDESTFITLNKDSNPTSGKRYSFTSLWNWIKDKLNINLKTINGNSIVGSGDLEIKGGVTSVNDKTGDVELSAADVGAVDLNSDQSISGKKTFRSIVAEERYPTGHTGYFSFPGGQIGGTENNLATESLWEFRDKIIYHPKKDGTIALIDDIAADYSKVPLFCINVDALPKTTSEMAGAKVGDIALAAAEGRYMTITSIDSSGNINWEVLSVQKTPYITEQFDNASALSSFMRTADQFRNYTVGITSIRYYANDYKNVFNAYTNIKKVVIPDGESIPVTNYIGGAVEEVSTLNNERVFIISSVTSVALNGIPLRSIYGYMSGILEYFEIVNNPNLEKADIEVSGNKIYLRNLGSNPNLKKLYLSGNIQPYSYSSSTVILFNTFSNNPMLTDIYISEYTLDEFGRLARDNYYVYTDCVLTSAGNNPTPVNVHFKDKTVQCR